MITPIFKGKVDKDGVLHVSHIQDFYQWIRSALKGKDVEVIVRPKKKLRSLNENNYYWGVVVQLIADHTKHTPNKIHTVLKDLFLPNEKIVIVGTKGRSFTKSLEPTTTTLTTTEMENYLSECRLWALDYLEVIIPLPNEVDDGKAYIA